MVTAQTTETGQVYLDGTRYSIQGRVQRQLISQQAPLFRTGDIGTEAHPFASIMRWNDQRGGIGIDIGSDNTRCWYSTCSLRHKGHIVLQRLTTQTAAASISGGIEFVTAFRGAIYAAYNYDILRYSNSGDAWTTVHSVGNGATDGITAPVGGTSTLAVAYGDGVDYTTDGSTWNSNTTSIKFLAWWRDVLWGVASSGAFYFTSDLSSPWTQTSTFTPQNGKITGIFVGPDGDGGEIIYGSAEDGLYFYDNEAERWVKVRSMSVPVHPTNGVGSVAWRESIYFPAGQAIYRYTPKAASGRDLVDLVGPDRDDGLPEVNQGVIRKLVTTHNELIALVGPDASTRLAGTRAFRGATAGPSAHRGAFSGSVTTASGEAFKATVLGWNGTGWEVKWQDENNLGALRAGIVSDAYSEYRLWWAVGGRVFWMAVPTGIVNPNRISTTDYASSGTWETPWFTADVIDFDKTAVSVHLDAAGITASSGSIVLQYALNYVDSSSGDYTTFATVTTDGDTEYFLPSGSSGESSADQSGIAFRAMKLKATLTRSSSNSSNSPDIKDIALVFDKNVEPLYGFVFTVNMRDNAQGVTSHLRRQNLEGLAASNNLVRFGYGDGGDSGQDFWVKVRSVTYLDGTGYDESDLAQVAVQEVH